MRFGDRIEIDFQIDDTMYSKDKDIELPPLMIQPIVENCFKHGLLHNIDKGHVIIVFEMLEERLFHCMVKDNGVGRSKAKVYAGLDKNDSPRGGLTLIKDRLQAFHNFQFEAEKYLKISDLFDPHTGLPSGTKVDLFIYY